MNNKSLILCLLSALMFSVEAMCLEKWSYQKDIPQTSQISATILSHQETANAIQLGLIDQNRIKSVSNSQMNSLLNSEGQPQQVAFVLGDVDTTGGVCSGVGCIIVGTSKVIQMIKEKIKPSTCKEDNCEKSSNNKEDSNSKPSRGGFII